jgi:hypothetical protein
MWNYFEPDERQWYGWALDGASAWMRKTGEEWKLSIVPIPIKSIDPDSSGPRVLDPPEDLVVSYAVSPGRKIGLRPRLSEKPYLVSARNEVKILPGAEAWFTIALPPVMRFELEGGQILFEGSPFTLSNTWFGDKTAGSLCLSMPIELDPSCKGERSLDQEACDCEANPPSKYLSCKSLIQCRVVVRNKSKEAIDLKRLAIFTDLINLYEKNDTLVSDTIVIVGTMDGSLQNNIDDTAFKGLSKIHAAAKTGLSEILVRRGVSFLRNITGI